MNTPLATAKAVWSWMGDNFCNITFDYHWSVIRVNHGFAIGAALVIGAYFYVRFKLRRRNVPQG